MLLSGNLVWFELVYLCVLYIYSAECQSVSEKCSLLWWQSVLAVESEVIAVLLESVLLTSVHQLYRHQ